MASLCFESSSFVRSHVSWLFYIESSSGGVSFLPWYTTCKQGFATGLSEVFPFRFARHFAVFDRLPSKGSASRSFPADLACRSRFLHPVLSIDFWPSGACRSRTFLFSGSKTWLHPASPSVYLHLSTFTPKFARPPAFGQHGSPIVRLNRDRVSPPKVDLTLRRRTDRLGFARGTFLPHKTEPITSADMLSLDQNESRFLSDFLGFSPALSARTKGCGSALTRPPWLKVLGGQNARPFRISAKHAGNVLVSTAGSG